jgi:hypothetical protein
VKRKRRREVRMGSPKLWAGSKGVRRTAAMNWGRFCYRLLYVMSFLAAMYAVRAHFHSASSASSSGT